MNSTDWTPDPSSDVRACLDILRRGSKSFDAASRLLPAQIRRDVAPVYAFCRVADDMIDSPGDIESAWGSLRERLDGVYTAHPIDHPVDRAFADIVVRHRIPRPVPDALLEGFAWEVAGRRYESLSDVRAYSVRVAATVGVMVTLILGRRDRETLARACDLGVAMQLTNIARDVGEDAKAGRVYLPQSWLRAAGLDADELIARPHFTPSLGVVVQHVLASAEVLYRRAETGIGRLPPFSRPAIRAARWIYADIGTEIARADYDSVSRRAHTSLSRKLYLGLVHASLFSRWSRARTQSASSKELPEARFLVDAVVGAPMRATAADASVPVPIGVSSNARSSHAG